MQHIYNWSGLGEVPPRVSVWINENTRLQDCGHEKDGKAKGGGQGGGGVNGSANCTEKSAQIASWDHYGTKRHSSAMAGLWRAQMPEVEATAVREACGNSGVMDALGYT